MLKEASLSKLSQHTPFAHLLTDSRPVHAQHWPQDGQSDFKLSLAAGFNAFHAS